MAVRSAQAQWLGDLKSGNGTMKLGSGAFEGKYSFASRFEEAPGTNPEELIGAAHAGCFSMALAHILTEAGHAPERVSTQAKVHLGKSGEGFAITAIDLITEAKVPGIDEATFLKHAEDAKANCPVSKALAATPIRLEAKLL
jgi:lipoyl-dependent peroxiredoxin